MGLDNSTINQFEINSSNYSGFLNRLLYDNINNNNNNNNNLPITNMFHTTYTILNFIISIYNQQQKILSSTKPKLKLFGTVFYNHQKAQNFF